MGAFWNNTKRIRQRIAAVAARKQEPSKEDRARLKELKRQFNRTGKKIAFATGFQIFFVVIIYSSVASALISELFTKDAGFLTLPFQYIMGFIGPIIALLGMLIAMRFNALYKSDLNLIATEMIAILCKKDDKKR